MRSARSDLFPGLLAFAMLLTAVPAFAANEGASDERLFRELESIKTRLVTVEQQQQQILAKEDKILEELDRVRIWVHRK